MDFEQPSTDPCVFIKHIENDAIILLVWVDDIIIASSSKELMDDFKQKLSNRFNMKDLGKLSFFLAIKFERTNETITMSQFSTSASQELHHAKLIQICTIPTMSPLRPSNLKSRYTVRWSEV